MFKQVKEVEAENTGVIVDENNNVVEVEKVSFIKKHWKKLAIATGVVASTAILVGILGKKSSEVIEGDFEEVEVEEDLNRANEEEA